MYGAARFLIDADYHRIGPHLIQPFDPARVQPASYDVTLGTRLLRPRLDIQYNAHAFTSFPEIDLRRTKPAELMEEEAITEEHGYILRPGHCALVSTAEQICCPNDMLCSVDGKSTIGRCFVAIHATAGFIDPGYCGAITLELVNHAPWNFMLRPGMCIGQLRFHWLGSSVQRPYGSPGLGSHYQGSTSVRAAEKLEE